MPETKYTHKIIEEIKEKDSFYTKTDSEKYAMYKSKDPFPKVGQALLNSADLLMYLLTVGIVEPFDVNNLKGVTYQCTFSGEAHYYDTKLGKMVDKFLKDDEDLELEQNSITYLKIKEKFHVPEYMALRFNLSVSNAYKGILLGTGPIVDPGFEGNLFIPLHNLTGNKYIIKKGAPLIRVEFTKLSTHVIWKAGKSYTREIPVDVKPITKSTPANANFSDYIEEALLDSGKKKFYASNSTIFVRSSIPDVISKAAAEAEGAHENAKNCEIRVKEAEDVVRNLSRKLSKWSIIGILSALFAAVSLVISAFSLVHDVNSRYDGVVAELKEYKQKVQLLESEIGLLSEQLKQYRIPQEQSVEESIEKESGGNE